MNNPVIKAWAMNLSKELQVKMDEMLEYPIDPSMEMVRGILERDFLVLIVSLEMVARRP